MPSESPLSQKRGLYFLLESAKVSRKRVFALLTPEIHSCVIAQMVRKPVFALPGCQRMSVNTLLCDTLGLADPHSNRVHAKGVVLCESAHFC